MQNEAGFCSLTFFVSVGRIRTDFGEWEQESILA